VLCHAGGVSNVRETYLAAAATAVSLVTDEATVAAWSRESVLPGMSVGVLASHLARSVLQVGWFLDGDVTGTTPAVSAVTYYARLADTESCTSALNTGVEKRSAETAGQGPLKMALEAQAALDALRVRLPKESADRRVAVAHRPGEELLLNEYLRTRLVELAVHTEDLALSVGVAVQFPEAAVSVAIDLLVAAARERHGDKAVLRALARRERDPVQALRVL
jgi:hypothetical protein